MARLVLVQGNSSQSHFSLSGPGVVLGRQPGVEIFLDSLEVSRKHARISVDNGKYFLEDLNSSNGTILNNGPVQSKTQLSEHDQISIGPYVFSFELTDETRVHAEDDMIIHMEVPVHTANMDLFKLDAGRKLQAVLEIAQQLARTLDLDVLLPQLLTHLLRLFVQAERALILVRENDTFVVQAVKESKKIDSAFSTLFSRSVVNRVFEQGVGIVAADARADQRFDATQTLKAMGIRSFICVPLKTHEGKILGVIQLDRFGAGLPFTAEDLNLATTIALQASVVMENAALHEDLLLQERLKRDVALAREIQEGFLPHDFELFTSRGLDFFARMYPAREVAGDFYDCFPLDENHLGFLIADVSGKGVPAALFMVAARTLGRHLALGITSPVEFLQALNVAISADNPAGMFVTAQMGVINPQTGKVVLSTAGHPPPIIRRANGSAELLPLPPGRLLGFHAKTLPLQELGFTLAPGEGLLLYTDGVTEARDPNATEMFGTDRLCALLSSLPSDQPLQEWGQTIRTAIDEFSGDTDLTDDITLVLVRRRGE